MDMQSGQENHSLLSNITNLEDLNNQIVEIDITDIEASSQFNYIDSLEETSIQNVLNESTFAANTAEVFIYDSRTFVAVNDETPGYSAQDDLVIEITGITDSIINIDPSWSDDIAEPEGGNRIIDVENEFNGDLDSAIAIAKDGDTVQLGNNTYYTSGIFVDRDITIKGEGKKNSIIDGEGTSESIFTLGESASGTTIENLRITNSNNGINSNGAFDLTIQNLEVDNIGLNQTIRDGQNNTGIILNRANGLELRNTYVHDVGRKGIGVNDTDGATISSLFVQNINLAAEHAQSFDAAGIKFFNTNDVLVQDFYLSNINAFNIWNDTTNLTTIEGNRIANVGNAFAAPEFNQNVDIGGIYNEKSSNSTVIENSVTTIGDFVAFNATAFTTESMTLENNDFSSIELNTEDFWVNEEIEKLIATTEDPDAANFDLFAEEFFAQANIG